MSPDWQIWWHGYHTGQLDQSVKQNNEMIIAILLLSAIGFALGVLVGWSM